ncbi:hypothetical protein IE077_003393, partial [Cardiosporidium cionae]
SMEMKNSLGNEILFYNNLGCIYFSMMKTSLASFYFNKALKANSSLQASSSKSFLIESSLPGCFCNILNMNFQAEIVYNIGLQALLKNKIMEAFLCFEEVSHIYPKHLRLWIRLAECCILMYENWKMKKQQEIQQTKKSVIQEETFSSLSDASANSVLFHSTVVKDPSMIYPMFRHYLTTPSFLEEEKRNETENLEDEMKTPSVDIYSLTGKALATVLTTSGYDALEYSKLCLEAVLLLILRRKDQLSLFHSFLSSSPSSEEIMMGDASSSHNSKTRPPLSPLPHEFHDSLDSFHHIYSEELSVYEDTSRLKLAYIYLCQQDYGASLSFCLPILQRNGILSKADLTQMSLVIFKKNNPIGCTYTSSVLSIYLAYTYAMESFLELGMMDNASTLMENYAEKKILEKSFALEYPSVGVSATHSTPSKITTPKRTMEKKGSSFDKQEKNSTVLGFSLSSNRQISSTYSFSIDDRLFFAANQMHDVHKYSLFPRYNPRFALCIYSHPSTCLLASLHRMNPSVLRDIGEALFANGSHSLQREAIKALPTAIVPSRTLLYILIAQGKHGEAVKFLRKLRSQRMI